MEGVAARAGVGKATIYRRWASKEELVRDAIVFLHEDFETPDTGEPARRLRGDRSVVPPARRAVGAATLAPRLLGEAINDPELHAIFRANIVEPRRDALRAPCSSARSRAARSAADVDLELMIDLFARPGRSTGC